MMKHILTRPSEDAKMNGCWTLLKKPQFNTLWFWCDQFNTLWFWCDQQWIPAFKSYTNCPSNEATWEHVSPFSAKGLYKELPPHWQNSNGPRVKSLHLAQHWHWNWGSSISHYMKTMACNSWKLVHNCVQQCSDVCKDGDVSKWYDILPCVFHSWFATLVATLSYCPLRANHTSLSPYRQLLLLSFHNLNACCSYEYITIPLQ